MLGYFSNKFSLIIIWLYMGKILLMFDIIFDWYRDLESDGTFLVLVLELIFFLGLV